MNSTTPIPSNAISVLRFADACLYKFNNKDITQIAEGSCDVFMSQSNDQTPTHQNFIYLKFKQLHQTLTSCQVFVKIQYTGSYCFLYQNTDLENFCLSIQKHNLQSEQQLIKFAQNFTVIDYNSELLEDRQLQSIRLHYSANIQKQDIGYDTKRGLKRVSRNIGLLSGKASNLIHSPVVSNSVQSLGNRVSHLSEQYVNENTWNSIKQKASVVNDQMTKIVRPVLNVIDNISSSIGKSFQASENKFIKGIREYSYAICDSLNEGERKGRINNGQLQNHQISKIQLKQ